MAACDKAAIYTLRRFTKAGISECRDALSRHNGNTYLAIRELLTDDDILEMHRSLRIRSIAPDTMKNPPTPEEIELVERLYSDLVPRVSWWRRWLARLLGGIVRRSAPAGWTDDMTFPLPRGVTEDQIVAFVISAGLSQASDEITEQRLTELFGLDAENAALARDRVYGGIIRAATRNAVNCPSRKKDPLAWLSFQRATNDPSIIAKIYPQLSISD